MTRLRGLVALAALLMFVVGIPYALVIYGNWPFTGLPNSGRLHDLTDTVVSDSTVFAVLTIAAWMVWAAFTASVLVELGATIRGIQAPRVAFAGPMQRSARILVAAIVLAATIRNTAPIASAAAAATTPSRRSASAVVVDIGIVNPSADPTGPWAPQVAASSRATSTTVGSDVVTVRRGDSAWSIAEAQLGDGMRWRELWELNHDVAQADGRAWTDPQVIRVGWQLRLPSDTIEPAPAVPAVATPTTPAATVAITYIVEPGDTLTKIASEQLGDPARYTEIYDLNRGVEQPDGRQLTDPNLIVAGWQLQLPSPPATPTEPTPPPPPLVQPETPPSTPTSPTSPSGPATTLPPPTTPPTLAPDPPTAASVDPGPDDQPPSTTLLPAPSHQTATDHRDSGDDDSGSTWAATAPVLLGVTGALVLATGLLGRLRWLRRRQATRSRHNRLPEPGVDPVEQAVVCAADVPLVRWAGQALAELCSRLDPHRVSGVPLAVELSDETGIELLWDRPQSDPPTPWSGADGGRAWRLTYDPEAAVPVDDLPAALPGLVTVGFREGRQLLVNLEAFGALLVTGDKLRVESFLRAVAVEFASGDELSDAYVHTVNVDVGLELPRLDECTPERAVERIESIAESVSSALAAAGTETSFGYRTGTAGGHIEINVFVANTIDEQSAARLVAVSPANRGVAVVTGSSHVHGPGCARLTIEPDGIARFEPLGVTFNAAGVPAPTASQLKVLLDDAAVIDVAEDGDADQLRFEGTVTAYDVAGDDGGDESRIIPSTATNIDTGQRSPLDAGMIVKVLGTPRIPDRPNLKRRETILTAFLACREGAVNASAVQDALWNGQAVQGKTLWNLVGATRTALGQLPDGTWVLPPSDRNRRMQGLAEGVTTDLAILRYLCDQARQVSSSEAIGLLQQGLGHVEGPPFDADGYDWAHHGTQHVAEAAALIERAVEHLVNLALDVDDTGIARDAIRIGLRGLPGHEVLYRLRMRVEHHAGNLSGVAVAFDELVQYLAEFETVPSSATVELHRDLVRPSRA